MSDLPQLGVADSGTVRKIVEDNRERGAARRASIVRHKAELLLELLDQPVQQRGFLSATSGKLLAVHGVKRLRDLLLVARQAIFKRDRHGDLQGAERADPRLRLAERIFETEYPFVSGHPEPSPLKQADDSEPTAATDAAHRLSEDTK